MKRLYMVLLLVCLLMIGGVLTGCSKSVSNPIKIEDIDWAVVNDNIWEQSTLSFNYTNNSKYTITDVELRFKLKENVTDEQLNIIDAPFGDVKDVFIIGYNRRFADPGETVVNSPCVINGTYTLVKNMDQLNLMEPDNIKISYIGKNNKMYATSYDYATKEYSEYGETIDLITWPDSKISKSIPKPTAKVITTSTDEEDSFWFKIYDYTTKDVSDYITKCKDAGFNIELSEKKSSMYAKNSEGYELSLSYNDIEETLNGSVEVADISESVASTDNIKMSSRSYANLTFDRDNTWKEEVLEDGRKLYYPPVEEETGFFQAELLDIKLGNLSDDQYMNALASGINGAKEPFKDVKDIDTRFFEIGGEKAVRYSFSYTTDSGIASIIDTVIVTHADWASMFMALYTDKEYYDTYKPQIDLTMSSIRLDTNVVSASSENVSSSSIRPEFKEALDSYEAFFDKYIAFMTSYNAGGGSVNKLSEYTEFMTQYADTMQKMGDLQSEDLTDEEMAYYLEVTTRISTKLLSVSGQ